MLRHKSDVHNIHNATYYALNQSFESGKERDSYGRIRPSLHGDDYMFDVPALQRGKLFENLNTQLHVIFALFRCTRFSSDE